MSLSLDRCEIECAGDGEPMRLARALLKQLPDITKAIPIEDVALALDIQAIEDWEFSGAVAALMTDLLKSEGRIGVKAGMRAPRRRFSIAHELGHFLNDRHEPPDAGVFACSAQDMASPIGVARHIRQEKEANAFAIEVLTPRSELSAMLAPAAEIDQPLRIADRFKVSSEAALRRYVDLHEETLAVAFAENGRLRYVVRSDEFPWIPLTKGDPIGEAPLTPRSGDRATSLDEVNAESWLEEGWKHQLFAQTLIQSDGFTSTLLVREAPDDEGDDY